MTSFSAAANAASHEEGIFLVAAFPRGTVTWGGAGIGVVGIN